MNVLSAILHRIFGPTPEEIRRWEWMDYWNEYKKWPIWWPPGEEWRAEKYMRAAEEAYYACMSGNL